MYLSEIPATEQNSSPNLQPAPTTFLEGALLFMPMLVTVTYLWAKNRIEVAREKEQAELQERNKLIETLQQQNQKLIEKLCEDE